MRRVRYIYFNKLLGQEIGFFNDPRFPASVIASRLTTDSYSIAGMTASAFILAEVVVDFQVVKNKELQLLEL